MNANIIPDFRSTLMREWRSHKLNYRLKFLAFKNLFSKKSVICACTDGPIVSLTSYGRRMQSVYLAIESIARGTRRPRRMILWVSDRDIFENLPAPLKRLAQRGLEIRWTEDLGPHKKYFPTLWLSDLNNSPLATADDDIYYPPDWLEKLYKTYLGDTSVINCYRAHQITFAGATIQPYSQWLPCLSTQPSLQNFATGVSGVLYPPEMLNSLRNAGKSFLQVAQKTDDIWLHAVAVRNGFKIRQIVTKPAHFPTIPDTQDNALMQSNVVEGANDVAIKATYSKTELDRMMKS